MEAQAAAPEDLAEAVGLVAEVTLEVEARAEAGKRKCRSQSAER